MEAGTDETSTRHGGVAVGLKLGERVAAIARLVPHVRVDDDVADALDERLALTWQAGNEELAVVNRQGDAESPPGTNLEPVGLADRPSKRQRTGYRSISCRQ